MVERPMIPTRYRVMAYIHFFVAGMGLSSALIDMFMERVVALTPINLAFAALNTWLGFNRLEGR